MTFGEKLRALRKSKGMTQAKLAAEIGINPSQLSSYECERSRPRPHTLEMLAQAFGVSVQSLTDENIDISEALQAPSKADRSQGPASRSETKTKLNNLAPAVITPEEEIHLSHLEVLFHGTNLDIDSMVAELLEALGDIPTDGDLKISINPETASAHYVYHDKSGDIPLAVIPTRRRF